MYLIKYYTIFSCFFGLIFFVSCGKVQNKTIDDQASSTTVMLFNNLQKIAEHHILFGHQHATEYGYGWRGDIDKSDVKMVTGSHPAVIGIDFSGFSGNESGKVETYKNALRDICIETYNRGGIITAAWHFHNPVTGGNFYRKENDSIRVVGALIPGGSYHEIYKEILKGIGIWAKSLRGSDGREVPVIFRPFHEFDGDWFWWGKSYTSKEEFINLWTFTVEYLRDSMEVHNFLYAFSPDNKFMSEVEFLERYPGDKWVDLVGMDNYADLGRDRYAIDTAAMKLKIVSDYAKKAGKLAAFTETGLESIPDTTWWTETLLKVLTMEETQLSYVLVWRNDSNSPTHYYAPFPGQVSEKNFLEFYRHEFTLFEKDLKNIYTQKW